MTVKQKMY